MTRFEIDRQHVIPSVHLNGTSRGELTKQYRGVYLALTEALAKLAEATPHGRDYYVQPDDGLKAARLKHEQRYRLLAQLLKEIETDYIEFAKDRKENK